MLDNIVSLLNRCSEISGWSVRHVVQRGAQLYAVPPAVESRRMVSGERYLIDVMRATRTPTGEAAVGVGNATLLPGGDIQRAIDAASLMASLVHNPPYGLPQPLPVPDVPLVDSWVQANPAAALEEMYARLVSATSEEKDVRMTAAECASEETTIHLVNSRGIDATQVSTRLDLEWVLIARRGEQEVETFVEMTRRRMPDFDLENEFHRRAHYAADLLNATAPPAYQGAVVLRGPTLAVFAGNGVIQVLSSAEAKYQHISHWEIGQPVFKTDPVGDPLNVWANRALPYGTESNAFDSEGIPAARVALIADNRLAAFSASQRYGEYLSLPVSGDFGNLELAPGSTPAADLLTGSYLEVVDFSWFNPDTVTGDFASEIRLGYIVENGKRTPFKGGMLVGNQLAALANVRWSAETGFFGSYFGPLAARFADLSVTAG